MTCPCETRSHVCVDCMRANVEFVSALREWLGLGELEMVGEHSIQQARRVNDPEYRERCNAAQRARRAAKRAAA